MLHGAEAFLRVAARQLQDHPVAARLRLFQNRLRQRCEVAVGDAADHQPDRPGFSLAQGAGDRGGLVAEFRGGLPDPLQPLPGVAPFPLRDAGERPHRGFFRDSGAHCNISDRNHVSDSLCGMEHGPCDPFRRSPPELPANPFPREKIYHRESLSAIRLRGFPFRPPHRLSGGGNSGSGWTAVTPGPPLPDTRRPDRVPRYAG